MRDIEPLPSRWRIVTAFLVAPLIAAFAMACVEPLYAGLTDQAERIAKTLEIYCLFGAYPTTLVFGVPTFLLLHRRLQPTALNCSLVGSVVAALPWLILTILPGAGEAIDNGQVTILHGRRTIAGWIFAGESVAGIAAFGLLAGLAFWVIATVWSKPSAT